MRILAVDDEYLSLTALQSAVRKAEPDAELHGFSTADEAVEFSKAAATDVAFLDIRLRDDTGISLAERLSKLQPKMNIIFTTGYSEYMRDAFALHASGYILKPVTVEKVRSELEHLRNPVKEMPTQRLEIRAFGKFEAFVSGTPLSFGYKKTKELLAFLVNANGAMCSLPSVAEALWEDGQGMNAHGSYIRNLLSDLHRVLQENGCGNVLLRTRGYAGIDRRLVRCDYYDYLEGTPEGLRAFRGEYMSQYSWSEYKLATLLDMSGKGMRTDIQ
jgi:two-component SAPR family response regulator